MGLFESAWRRWQERPVYRGPDRRVPVETGRSVVHRAWVAAGLTFGAIIAAFALFALLQRFGPLPGRVVVALRSAALVLSAVLAVVARLHWRVTGLLRGCRISTAGWLLVGVGAIGLIIDDGHLGASLIWLGLALAVTAAAWVVWGLVGPDVDTSARPGVDVLLALLVVGLVWGVLLVVAPAGIGGRPDLQAGVAALVAGAVWSAVAVMSLVRAIKVASMAMGWMAWLGAGVGVSALARFAALRHDPDWLGLAAAALLWGLLLACLGLAGSLGQNAIDRRGQLHAAAVDARSNRTVVEGTDRRRTHEIRNALVAIEGATHVLERFGAELTEEERADLRRAVTRGVGHLRSLVDPAGDGGREPAPHSLAGNRRQGADGGQDLAQILEAAAGLPADLQGSAAAGGRPVIEHHHDVGVHPEAPGDDGDVEPLGRGLGEQRRVYAVRQQGRQ